VVSGEAGHEVTCAPDDLSRVRDALERRFGAADVARLDWKPNISVAIDERQAETVFKLLAVLDDNDDVQRVMANYEVSDEVLERLSA
jgi:transcriptional/translational regulatory protein YebC/TACO1